MLSETLPDPMMGERLWRLPPIRACWEEAMKGVEIEKQVAERKEARRGEERKERKRGGEIA